MDDFKQKADALKAALPEEHHGAFDALVGAATTAFTEHETNTKKLDDTVKKLEKSVKEKDELIDQKNRDLVGQRREYKKLSELSEAEKAAMSEKEIELQKRQEEVDNRLEEMKKQQEELHQKEVEARKSAAVRKLVGEDAELQKKVLENFGRLKDVDAASTEEEITAHMTTAFNMLGEERPDPVRSAVSGSGDNPAAPSGTQFAETTAGKEVASALGLSYSEEGEQKTD